MSPALLPTNHHLSSPVTPPKVLVSEKISADGLALLKEEFEVHERFGLAVKELQNVIEEYDALIVRSETKVTKELLGSGMRLKVVARAGVGVDNVDVPAATNLGIVVVNSPAGNIGAAAEHTIALLLATARNVPDACASLKAGKWERSRFTGVELKGKQLGIIGLGKVGITVARFAQGLGMNVSAVDPYASPSIAQAANVTLVLSLRELLPMADFLTIHTPLIASTKGMIGAAELASMKRGARVLNVARGGMIDEAALLAALENGHIAGAGIDVFSEEPPTQDSAAMKLIAHPKVVATPHLGASTVEAQENVSKDVCEQVRSILLGGLPKSAVNAPLILPEEYKTLQPFVRLVEKMGSLYTQHYMPPRRPQSGPFADKGTTFDLIYEGSLATLSNTKPLYAALIKGLTASVISTNVNIVNAEMVARDRGIVVNEQHSRAPADHTYSSLVTLRARPATSSRATSPLNLRNSSSSSALTPPTNPTPSSVTAQDRTISGYVSNSQIYISRLDRFATSFIPEGNLLICHNYDSPGKIGIVGGLLGGDGVNINFMTVAALSSVDGGGVGGWAEGGNGGVEKVGGSGGMEKEGGNGAMETKSGKLAGSKEALMILGLDAEVNQSLLERLKKEEGILDVGAVVL